MLFAPAIRLFASNSSRFVTRGKGCFSTGVASGKFTLVRYHFTVQSTAIQVFVESLPLPEKMEPLKNVGRCSTETLRNEASTADDATGRCQKAFDRLYKNEQLDECHLLFACPAFYQPVLEEASLSETVSNGSKRQLTVDVDRNGS